MKQTYGRTLAGIIGFYLMQPLTQVVIIYLASAYYASMTGGRDAQGMAVFLTRQGSLLLMITNLLCLGGIFAFARGQKKPFLDYTGLRGSIRLPSVFFLCAVLGVSSNFWSTFMLSLLPLPSSFLDSYVDSMSMIGAGPLWVELVTIVLVSPILEEILFRGLIFDRLRKIMPVGLAVVFQGLLFGSLHGDPVWITYAAILGCVLCYVRLLTNTVRASIVVHIVFNASSYLFSLIAERYLTTYSALLWTFFLSAALFIWSVSGINKRRDRFRIV